MLTSGQVHWFGATYGDAQHRGGGSNMPVWTRDGNILFARKRTGSKVPWEYRADQPDTDHFNRTFKLASARGGTELCRLNPKEGTATVLTHSDPHAWDFRPTESPDGQQIAFCRAAPGGLPVLWVMDQNGRHARLVTGGLDNGGADHPRWLAF